jgi:hypothetical protein
MGEGKRADELWYSCGEGYRVHVEIGGQRAKVLSRSDDGFSGASESKLDTVLTVHVTDELGGFRRMEGVDTAIYLYLDGKRSVISGALTLAEN